MLTNCSHYIHDPSLLFDFFYGISRFKSFKKYTYFNDIKMRRKLRSKNPIAFTITYVLFLHVSSRIISIYALL